VTDGRTRDVKHSFVLIPRPKREGGGVVFHDLKISTNKGNFCQIKMTLKEIGVLKAPKAKKQGGKGKKKASSWCQRLLKKFPKLWLTTWAELQILGFNLNFMDYRFSSCERPIV